MSSSPVSVSLDGLVGVHPNATQNPNSSGGLSLPGFAKSFEATQLDWACIPNLASRFR